MTGLFVDTFDLYHRVKRKFDGKIAFDVFVEDADTDELYAYGMLLEGKNGFVSCLRSLGYKTRFKKPRIFREVKMCDWGVGMAMDVVSLIERGEIDTIIFATCNLSILPIMKWLRRKNIKVIVWGVDIPEPLQVLADGTMELTEEHLEEE